MSAAVLQTPALFGEADDARFRRVLWSSVFTSAILGSLFAGLPRIPLPEALLPEEPPRIVELEFFRPPPPPPPPPPPQVQPPAEPAPAPKPAPAAAARPAAAQTLAALSRELAALGAGANVLQGAGPNELARGSAGSQAGSGVLREGTGRGSGGIGEGSAGHYAGSGLGLRGHGTQQIGEAGGGGGRGRGQGVPGRGSAEIQAVFERHKAQVDQLYQDALAGQPGMQGEVLLQLTIEPDGRVSACKILHSALQNAALEQKLVQFVRALNFGAKAVPVQTENYTIRLFQS